MAFLDKRMVNASKFITSYLIAFGAFSINIWKVIDTMSQKRIFKILSIDGGGILGLYSVDILRRIQAEFLDNKPIFTEFQLITGTSTGGIIALGLALGKNPEEISDFYLKYRKKIFPWLRSLLFPGGFFHNKYSNRKLQNALRVFFEDATISDCKTAVCIPVIDVSNWQPMIFKTNNDGTQRRDLNVKLRDIAIATSSAPSFFPIYSFGVYTGLIDGGLWQNNPALFGVIEACNCFIGPDKNYDKIRILSIGNPFSGIRQSLSAKIKSSGIIRFREKLVSLPMKISSLGTHYILNFLSKSNALSIDSYLRIESENLPISFNKLKLDSASDDTISKLLERSNFDFNNKKHEIIQFFREEM